MATKRKYTDPKLSAHDISALQDRFFREAGGNVKLLCELFEALPNIAFTLKNAEGRIIYTNPYNARISGWQSPKDLIGYTSYELYPPDQAAVYGSRDHEVFETGKPIVNRLYGFVADRSPALNCVTVRPVSGQSGQRIGTATIYYRAQEKLQSTNWYGPIRESIAYLNEHITENVPIRKLAALSHYSENQFRRLFTQLTQMSPSGYIARTRVNLAKTLLNTTDDPITDIALKCGFYDHAHFIRTFRTLTGTTPAKFRRVHQVG